MEFLIISGMSGAGKSEAIKVLEDIGYFCMDNVPPMLLPQIVDLLAHQERPIEKVAVVVDIRGRGFFKNFFLSLENLRNKGINVKILFLEATDRVLVSRYKELRRPHPLTPNGMISEGIDHEREMLEDIKKNADYIIDTSTMSNTQLKSELRKLFYEGEEIGNITIVISSFGFKHGILDDADLVFDVRFIPNPYYIDELRPLTGKDEPVSKYVLENPITIEFLDKLRSMLKFLIPHYEEEGKTQLIIGIGCTGGQHRSVAIAIKLKEVLENAGERVTIEHRDVHI
ncbi:MAG: RNase adapter RapZ [Tissierellia bacterium]|nr:RNase adapter RapZ [Tissierellia bacterium]